MAVDGLNTQLFGRENRGLKPQEQGDAANLAGFSKGLDLKNVSNNGGLGAAGEYKLDKDPDEAIGELLEDFKTQTADLQAEELNPEDTPFYNKEIPTVEFSDEARDSITKLVGALSADYNKRGKESYLMKDEGKSLMKALVPFLTLRSESDDESLQSAQTAIYSLISKQVSSNTKRGRLDSSAKDIALRLQSPNFARDPKRQYNLGLTLIRMVGAKEFAKPAEKNDGFVNVYKKIQDAFAIGGDKEIGAAIAKNVHEFISPILEGPINKELEENLGEDVVSSIKQIRKEVWDNAKDNLLATSTLNKFKAGATFTVRTLDKDGKGVASESKAYKDYQSKYMDLVENIGKVFTGEDTLEAEEQVKLILRDVSFDIVKNHTDEQMANTIIKDLTKATTGQKNKVTSVSVPTKHIKPEQQQKILEGMLNSAKSRYDNLAQRINDLTETGGVTRYKAVKSKTLKTLQDAYDSAKSSDGSENPVVSFKVGNSDVSVTAKTLKALINKMSASSNHFISNDYVSELGELKKEDDSTVESEDTRKLNLIVNSLISNSRESEVNSARTQKEKLESTYNKVLQELSGNENASISTVEYNDTGKFDLSKDLKVSDDATIEASKLKENFTKAFNVFGKYAEIQVDNSSQESRKLALSIKNQLRPDVDIAKKQKKHATKMRDLMLKSVVKNLNQNGLASASHSIAKMFHKFITSDNPDGNEIDSQFLEDLIKQTGGGEDVFKELQEFYESRNVAFDAKREFYKGEQTKELNTFLSETTLGKTPANNKQLIQALTGATSPYRSNEEAISALINKVEELAKVAKDERVPIKEFNLSADDIKSMVDDVDPYDKLSLAKRDLSVRKTLLKVLVGLNSYRGGKSTIGEVKARVDASDKLDLQNSSKLTKFDRDYQKIDTTYSELLNGLDSKQQDQASLDLQNVEGILEYEKDSLGDVVTMGTNLVKELMNSFIGLFMGAKSDNISEYKQKLMGDVQPIAQENQLASVMLDSLQGV